MNHIKNSLSLEVLSLHSLTNDKFTSKILDMIMDGLPFLMPKKFGICDPLKHKVTVNSNQAILKTLEIADTLVLDCGNGSGYLLARGDIIPEPVPSGVYWSISFDILNKDPDYLNQTLNHFKSLVKISDSLYSSISSMAFKGWYAPQNLQLRLPEIPWVSVYGQPYIEMFGKDRILSAPFYQIEELESGHLFLQATESVFEPIPRELKEKIRKHLGEDAFMAGTKTQYKDGRAPNFDFSELMPRK